jgi:dihydropteroate synthase
LQRSFEKLIAPREPWAGLDLAKPQLMGIVNVTPDSFSDGGLAFAADKATAAAKHLWHEGASIVDLGAESTRPGAEPVTEHEELRRIVPVLDQLKSASRPQGALLSIDTRQAGVMLAAIAVTIINDLRALTDDAAALPAVVAGGVHVREMEERYRPEARLPGTLAGSILAIERAAQILRVHDVAEVRQAVKAWRAVIG